MSLLSKLIFIFSLLYSGFTISAEPTNITFSVLVSDAAKKTIITELVEKAINENNQISVNPKLAFSHIYIMAQQDVNDNVNADGWTFAVAHINNNIPLRLVNTMEAEGVLEKEPVLRLAALMIQEQGFLKHLNLAHSSNFKRKSIEQIINSFINDFALRASSYNDIY